MEHVLDEVVSSEDLKKFERTYYDQFETGKVTKQAQFEYAWCLVRSKYAADIRKGIMLLEDLYNKYKEDRRDYLYFLASGNARIKEYTKALHYCRSFLQIEPGNAQVQDLETIITKKMDREGKIGIALAGAGVLLVGGIVGLGFALSKPKT